MNSTSRTIPNEQQGVLDRVVFEFATMQRRSGIHEALRYLNARTQYRFTGVYRLDPPFLRGVEVFDRENADLRFSGGVYTVDDTHCSIVCATTLSYLGVPIRLRDGGLVGVLCHHDARPRLAPAGEMKVLESIAPRLARWTQQHQEVFHTTAPHGAVARHRR